jgi:hypothetical protein
MGAAKPVVLFKARYCFSSQNGSVKSSAEGTDEAVDGDEGEEVVCGEGNACPARQEATVVVDGEGEPRLLLLLLLLLLLPAILLLSSWCCGLVQNGNGTMVVCGLACPSPQVSLYTRMSARTDW